MLLLLDLDNTLIDRTGSFRRWSAAWAPAHGGGPADVAWLRRTDDDGYAPRDQFAAQIAARFGLDAGAVLAELRAGMIDQLRPDPEVARALGEAVAAGWSPVVVTNGSVRQQEAKLRHTGLDQVVAGWIVSEGAGARKPERRIFELAAELAGLPLRGWMVGDHAEYDVGGGRGAGLETIWLPHGRDWPAALPYAPTRTAPDCAAAIRSVLFDERRG